jgi:D-serine deaminase-like pyridoxal phosphate-dependent protein
MVYKILLTRLPQTKEPECQVGRHWSELDTPALLLDLDVAQRNLATMASFAERASVAVRPHFKAHKSVELARLQIEAGAVGVTVATVAEAQVLVDAGVNDVLVANQTVQPFQVEALSRMASRARLCVLIDDPANLRSLAMATSEAGSELGVLVEVDTGMGRCGVRHTGDAIKLAQLACELDSIRFEGVSAYEGHCTGIEDPVLRSARTRESLEMMIDFVEAVRSTGIDIATVSAGGTSTFAITGADPRVTEIQPGAYALMDLCRCRLVSEFELALSVVGTVVSRKGARGVLDCGLKAISSKEGMPVLAGDLGEVVTLDEEHLRFDADGAEPRIGQRLQVLPTYGPLTIYLYDRFHVIRDGHVIAEWPVSARR